MKKLAWLWSFVFFTLAALPLLSNCGMDAAQTSKPPVMAGSASGSTPATVSPNTQPVVADYANGATATAATTDASYANQTVGAAPSASAAAFASADATEYRISQQDILQISVFQINDLNSAVQVSQDGNITLPLVGKIQVAGRTTSESEQIIAAKLRQKYLQSPQVSVSVKTYGRRITVSGEVKGPRVLADDGNTTLSQAIANAGGTSDLANAERVHIARSKDQHVQDEIYNLDDIQAGKVTDPLLRGGDIVVVEQSGVKVALKNVASLLPFAFFATLF
ncbi:MAG: polysaccharide biosynthesis/export family protein [Xanthobacteraceae bacterium]